MVAYDGAEGAMLSVGIFVVGMIALHAALKAFLGLEFDGRDVLLWSLIMVVAGAILAAYDRIVIGGGLPPGGAPRPDRSSPPPPPAPRRAGVTPATTARVPRAPRPP